ncbi:MAG TPA: adenosine deaminase [Clostridia bacterium]|nr:adenosine deaminase [Clostridia bacterium]
MRARARFAVIVICLSLLTCSLAAAQAPAAAPVETPEQHTAKHFDSIKGQPSLLMTFLRQMPKGGDLHNHMTGAVYAESYIQWAAEANLCADRSTLALSAPPCKGGQVEAKQAQTDPVLYREMIDNWSMRGYPWSSKSGHDHFFDTFQKFDPAGVGRYGDMLAELASRAADGNVQYLELMLSPDEFRSIGVGAQVGWDDNFSRMRDKMLADGVRALVTQSRKSLDTWEARRDQLLRCKESNKSRAEAGCAVETRYIFQVLRGFPRESVFSQILTAFELAQADPRVVSLNLVMPEDALIPMRDFRLHMKMLSFLHEMYPSVHITLHAGELTPGLVPPDGLRFHIRESIEMGHAERIGHGVDIMWEDDPHGLLADMAKKNIMTEICLTSNDAILGVKGKQHPLAMYLKYGVPVALATDDEGVARSEMTREYIKAVEEQGLDYLTLKKMARTSLQYAFLPGTSLWQDARKFTVVKDCAVDRPMSRNISAGCQKFLAASEKARQQWRLEASYAEFETQAR